MILIKNKKNKIDKMHHDYPSTPIIDLTSKSDDLSFRVLSPFFPHQDANGHPVIPIPFSQKTSYSVEGIWQGLVHCNKRRVGLRGGVESTFHLFLQYLL